MLSALLVAGVLALPSNPLVSHPVAASTTAGRSPDRLPAALPELDWESCYQQEARQARRDLKDPTIRFQCAVLRSPLDHDEPRGPKIDVAVVRLPARKTDNARSLMLNPGGPGGSGIELVVYAGPSLYRDPIRNNFDLVSFDPRGIGRSVGLRCFDRPGQQFALYPDLPYPSSRQELRSWERGDDRFTAACRRRDPRIMAHMSTANVARDMDLIRQAVGDDQLTYQGFSYGTFLGITYANLFPDKVRALVLDAVVDPVAWSGQGVLGKQVLDERLGSSVSARQTLKEFFRLCNEAGPRRCAFAPRAEKRWNALLAHARQTPITYLLGDEILITETDRTIVFEALGAMYGSDQWQGFARGLAFLEAEAGLSRNSSRSRWAPFPEQTRYYGNEGFFGVLCSDSDSPSRFGAWVEHARTAPAPFGPLWTLRSSPCASWPVVDEDRYTGPYTAQTANPILITSTTFDPATPYAGATALRRLAPGSRLVTVEGWGHTMYGTSRCGDRIVDAYLLRVEVPERDQTCQQDANPFSGRRSETSTGRDRLEDILRASTLPG
jgi:pimeloyl-ACP methyl ester carboxylesterase